LSKLLKNIAAPSFSLRLQQRNEIMKNFTNPVKLFFKIIFQHPEEPTQLPSPFGFPPEAP
jgi:hypothetical protein